MNNRILFCFCLIFLCASAYSQDRSFGIRIGNPIGVSYKQYTDTRKAFEFILATSAPGWAKNYYENSFYDIGRFDGYTYSSHRVKGTLHLGARYLLQYDIPTDGMDGTLNWYWGLGGYLRYSRVDYKYVDDEEPVNLRTSTRTNLDLGIDGIGGMEYTFENMPLTLFGELNLGLELVDRPLTLQVFGGVGLRFRF